MRFKQYFSGSSGNMYEVVASNGKSLIIDIGVTWKKAIRAMGYDMGRVEAVFSDHEHKDHCMSIKDAMDSGLEVYSNKETFESQGLQDCRRANVVKNNDVIKLDSFVVTCFDMMHDVPCLGFVIREIATGEFMLFVTDTKTIKQKFNIPFSIVAIELSYCIVALDKLVEEHKVNETYAKRLISSHMEREVTKRYLSSFCNLSKCREIHLLHMSGSNIRKEKTREEFEELFMRNVIAI